MRVRLSAAAREYLRRETAYLSERNRQAAQRFADAVRAALKSLAEFKRIGPASEELPVPGLRRLVVGDHVLLYEIRGDETFVLAIRHGRQAPLDFVEDDFDYEAVSRDPPERD